MFAKSCPVVVPRILGALCVVLLTAAAQTRGLNAEQISAQIALVAGQIIDGTGAPIREGDVAIVDGMILLPEEDDQIDAEWTIDCRGLWICPGFIDLHNHSDGEIEQSITRAAANYVTQGCTTMVTGNCGSGPVDVGDYYDTIDRLGAGTNIAHLIPQGALRREVLASARVEPTPQQLDEMRQLVEAGMEEGAWGMSTGLIYVPSSFASTEEITELAKIVAAHSGIYASHIRGEGTMLLESIDEALQIGRDANLPVHISHFKSSGRDAWGLVREAARIIAARRDQGHAITADQYPYIASSTSLGATLLPSWAREGGDEALHERLTTQAEQMHALINERIEKANQGRAIRIASYKPEPQWVGQDLATIAQSEQTTMLDIAEQILRNGDASIVNFSMNEEDVRHIMAIDWVATASDGGAKIPGATKPHPRNYGTFPRKLAHYAMQEKVLPLEQAVRSMTGLPAEILSLRDRGLIRSGLVADIAVLDPAELKDTATFEQPHQYAEGVRYVFINGKPSLVDREFTGALNGESLRKVPTSNSQAH